MLLKSFYDVDSSFARLGLVDNLKSMYIDSFKSIENKTSLHSNKNMCIHHKIKDRYSN